MENLKKKLRHDCIYISPIKHADKDENNISVRLKDLSEDPIPKRIKLLKRSPKLRKSFFLFLYEKIISDGSLMGLPLCIACKMEKMFAGIYNE